MNAFNLDELLASGHASVWQDAGGAVTVELGDGLRLRILPNGVIRLRSKHHTISVGWLTNKPEDGDQSVLGVQLNRKD